MLYLMKLSQVWSKRKSTLADREIDNLEDPGFIDADYTGQIEVLASKRDEAWYSESTLFPGVGKCVEFL